MMTKTLSSLASLLLSVLLLSGCDEMGHIYPANLQAEQLGGEMPAHFTTFSTGNGTIEAVGPGGEVLKGHYNPPPAGYTFGQVFKEVLGEYSTNPAAADKGTPTVATLNGSAGTVLNCEFYNNDRTNNGFGGCKSTAGALYRIQY